MKLTFGREIVYTFLQVEINWLDLFYFGNYSAETFTRKMAVA